MAKSCARSWRKRFSMQDFVFLPRPVPRTRAASADRHRHRGRGARLARRAGRATRRSRGRPLLSGARRRSRPSSRLCSATCISRKAASLDRQPTRTASGARSQQSPRSWAGGSRHAAAARWELRASVRPRDARARIDHGASTAANLTHGTTYLEEYAPRFLRSLLGAAPRRPRRHECGGRRSVLRRRAASARAALRHVPQRREAQRRFQRRQLRLDARRRRHGSRRRAG